MKPYPSYKDSDVEWIGRIPSHWDTKKIKYQFTIEKNQVSVSEFESNKVIHWYRSKVFTW
jgi:type I restriction enzyme, S subunit